MALPLRPLRTPAPSSETTPRLEDITDEQLADVTGGLMTQPIALQQLRGDSTTPFASTC